MDYITLAGTILSGIIIPLLALFLKNQTGNEAAKAQNKKDLLEKEKIKLKDLADIRLKTININESIDKNASIIDEFSNKIIQIKNKKDLPNTKN